MEEVLRNIGLSPEEASIYLSLLSNGPQTAVGLGKSTKVKRTYVYKIVQQLIKKGLIETIKEARTTKFAPLSPDHLLTLAESQKQKADQAKLLIETSLGQFKSMYTLVEKRPLVTTYEGIEGIKRIYQDILDTKVDLLLLRSLYDESKPELEEVLKAQLQQQIHQGIHVRTITPLVDTTKETFLKHDAERLIKRHIIHKKKLELPSQIIVYHDKVAIISLKSSIISTLIVNQDISDTFKAIFEFMWDATSQEHEEIIAKWA